ncbi:unnamed protein product [Gadus morhua 'NCC']
MLGSKVKQELSTPPTRHLGVWGAETPLCAAAQLTALEEFVCEALSDADPLISMQPSTESERQETRQRRQRD